MAVYKGRTQFVKSFHIVEISIDLGFRVWKDETFSLRGVNKWELDEETASAAKRALINLVSGKKKKTIYVELEDSREHHSKTLYEADLYVPGLSYGEFNITIAGESCLHINRILSWLYDSKFKHGMVLDILNANKRAQNNEEET